MSNVVLGGANQNPNQDPQELKKQIGPIQQVFAKNLKDSLVGYEAYLDELMAEKTIIKQKLKSSVQA